MRTVRDVLGGAHAARLHVAVAAPPAVHAPRDLEGFAPEADVVELRLDLLGLAGSQGDLREWVRSAGRPVLATIRSAARPMGKSRCTIVGDLPPSSRVTGTRFSAAAFMTRRPTCVDPV